MPIVDAPKKTEKSGVSIATRQTTTIQIQAPSLQILIGGAYTVNGTEHTYGHVALRVIGATEERVYDFGRYNGETGPYGQGRLRVWTKFSKYIAGENATGRATIGFLYRLPPTVAEQVNKHYSNMTLGRPVLKAYGDHMKEYRLGIDYHALENNCTTMAMSGARLALRDLDFNVSKNNEGRGMSFIERNAAKVAGWPSHIFMPADLQKMLEENTTLRPVKVERFGGGK